MSEVRRRKSVKVDVLLLIKIHNFITAQPTKYDAAEALGISRQTLDRLIGMKSCSPETLETIKKVITDKI